MAILVNYKIPFTILKKVRKAKLKRQKGILSSNFILLESVGL